MKVALVGYGTRGDVQPFVCLGRALADAGHTVELTASVNGEQMVRAAGLPFRPFAFDAQELLDSEEARRMLADGRMRAFFGWLQEAERPFLEHNRRVLIEASRDADVIVCGVLMVARCAAVAASMGIPRVPLHLCPGAPSRSYVPVMLPQRNLGPANRIAHGLPQWAFYRSQRDDLAKLHAELGLPPPRWRRWRHGFGPEAPSLLAYSQTLFPAPSDWSADLHPAGPLEPWPELRGRLGEVGIPEELDEWLEAGPEPVFFGFGSMPVLDGATTLDMIRVVAADLGVRAIVAAGWSRLEQIDDGNLFVLDAVDHQDLLPRCGWRRAVGERRWRHDHGKRIHHHRKRWRLRRLLGCIMDRFWPSGFGNSRMMGVSPDVAKRGARLTPGSAPGRALSAAGAALRGPS